MLGGILLFYILLVLNGVRIFDKLNGKRDDLYALNWCTSIGFIKI